MALSSEAQPGPVDGETLIATDRSAVAGWVFMAIWLGILLLFTYFFIRDGGFRQFAPPLELGVMMLFWLFGLGGAGYFLAIPMVALSIAPGGIFVLQERTLRARRVTRFAISDASRPRLRKTRDSEGDDYFRIEVVLPERRRVGVGGANDLGDAETRLAEMDRMIDGL